MIQTSKFTPKVQKMAFLTLLLMSALPPVLAQALEVTGVAGVNYAAPTQRLFGADQRLTGNATVTFGLLGSVNLFDSGFDFETGVLSITQQSERDNVLPPPTQKLQFVEIPFVIRYNLDESIGLGAGGYVAFAQGNIVSVQNGITTETTYELSNFKRTDGGLIANIRAKFALSPPLYFILDARYQHGLVNLSNIVGDIFNTRSVQAMAGLTYRFDFSASRKQSENNIRIVNPTDE